MLFKDAKPGYQIHILAKDPMEYREGKVVSVGTPYFPPMPNTQSTQPITRIIDITVECKGVTKTYVVRETEDIAFTPDIIISTHKDGLLAELRSIKKSSEDILSSVDRHKQTVTKCNALLMELDDHEREKQQTETRLTKLEDGIAQILKALQKSST